MSLSDLLATHPDWPENLTDMQAHAWAHALAGTEYAPGAASDSTVRVLGHLSRNRLIGWATKTAKNITWPAYVAETSNPLEARALVRGALDIVYHGEGAGGPGADIGDAETQEVLDALRALGDAVLSAAEREALEALAAVYVTPLQHAGIASGAATLAHVAEARA